MAPLPTRCCLCLPPGNVNLKCFDKLTGELLWNRLETSPFVDEVGDVWTDASQQLAKKYDLTSIGSDQLDRQELEGRAYLSNLLEVSYRTLYRRSARHIDGETGELIKEYILGTDENGVRPVIWPTVSEGWGANAGEIIRNGKMLTSLSTSVPVAAYLSGGPTTIRYTIGPTGASYVDEVTFYCSSDGEPLPTSPTLDPVVLSPNYTAIEIRDEILNQWSDVVTDVVVVSGNTIARTMLIIDITFTHEDFHIGGVKIGRLPVTTGGVGAYNFDNPADTTYGISGYGWFDPPPAGNGWGQWNWEYGASGRAQWCDDGSVSTVSANRTVFSGRTQIHYRVLNFDVSSSPWTERWRAPVGDLNRQTLWEAEDWELHGFVTSGGWSRVYSTATALTTLYGIHSQVVSMSETSDNGATTLMYGTSEKPDGDKLTSDEQSGVLQHGEQNMNVYEDGFFYKPDWQPNRQFLQYYPKAISHNTSRVEDGIPPEIGATDYVYNQFPKQGLTTGMRKPVGFDESSVYVAGHTTDPSAGAYDPVTVAASRGFDSYTARTFGATSIIERQLGGYHYSPLYVHPVQFYFSNTTNFSVQDCKWRIVITAEGIPVTTDWFEHSATIDEVNASLLDSFGSELTGWNGPIYEYQTVKWEEERATEMGTAYAIGEIEDAGNHIEPMGNHMLWQHGGRLSIRINRGWADGLVTRPEFWAGPNGEPWSYNLPYEWAPLPYVIPDDPSSGYATPTSPPARPVTIRIELTDVVRYDVKEIGSMDWTGRNFNWSRNWSRNETGVTWGRVHAGRMLVAGRSVKAEIPIPE